MPELTRVPCPECGEPNLTTDTVCLHCGKALRFMPRPPLRRILTNSRRPTVSGKMSAFALGACFVLSGILMPVAAHLPHWVEFELVLAAWWVVWIAALAVLLYRGLAVDDDAPPTRLGTGPPDAFRGTDGKESSRSGSAYRRLPQRTSTHLLRIRGALASPARSPRRNAAICAEYSQPVNCSRAAAHEPPVSPRIT